MAIDKLDNISRSYIIINAMKLMRYMESGWIYSKASYINFELTCLRDQKIKIYENQQPYRLSEELQFNRIIENLKYRAKIYFQSSDNSAGQQ